MSAIPWIYDVTHFLPSPPVPALAAVGAIVETRKCVYFNGSGAGKMIGGSSLHGSTELCEGDSEKRVHCYSTWRNSSGLVRLERQGCWLDDFNCYDRFVDLYCHCKAFHCFQIFLFLASPPDAPFQVTRVLLSSGVPLLIVSAIIVLLFWFYRQHGMTYLHHAVSTQEDPDATPASPLLGLKPLQLLELRAHGHYGTVWKAQMLNQLVAVKVFPLGNKNSWQNEMDIFSTPGMKHDHLLQFLAGERRGSGLDTELWLITVYHEKGSITDFLKGNVLSWVELCRIAESMARGLSFLHEEGPDLKPAIAHRLVLSNPLVLLNTCWSDEAPILSVDASLSRRTTSTMRPMSRTKPGTKRRTELHEPRRASRATSSTLFR
uniref:receptor protein serine/threonine kinase n=1 Tax=Eptatretus burgeri TaxID=7764 RepID=A0A8C4RAU9_EPTBU